MNFPPFRKADGWYCQVAWKTFGPWPDKGSALAGYKTELARFGTSLKRKTKGLPNAR